MSSTDSHLRVGLVVPRFTPFRGGMETYTEHAARALAARGASVTVVTQAPRSAGLPSRAVQDGYTIERYPLPFGSSFDLPSPAAARAATRRNRFDVLWAHSYHTPLAWLVAERARTSLVFTPHYHGTGHTLIRTALHRPYRFAGRRLVAASCRIVVDTEAEAGLLSRDFPREARRHKLAVVPLAVENPVRGEPYPDSTPMVLTVARQEPYKRTDLLIRAIAELRGRGTRVRLVVVGDGSSLVACAKLAERLRVQDIVTLTGLIDDKALGRWWASATVYATASRQEAFGITVAQALVAGLPVVASEIAAHQEVIRRAGPATLAELIPADIATCKATVRYADAIERLAAVGGPGAERARACTLPTPVMMADQLLDVLVTSCSGTDRTGYMGVDPRDET
jgi:glycosyltransferase involved in cell wall biosynthesis